MLLIISRLVECYILLHTSNDLLLFISSYFVIYSEQLVRLNPLIQVKMYKQYFSKQKRSLIININKSRTVLLVVCIETLPLYTYS